MIVIVIVIVIENKPRLPLLLTSSFLGAPAPLFPLSSSLFSARPRAPCSLVGAALRRDPRKQPHPNRGINPLLQFSKSPSQETRSLPKIHCPPPKSKQFLIPNWRASAPCSLVGAALRRDPRKLPPSFRSRSRSRLIFSLQPSAFSSPSFFLFPSSFFLLTSYFRSPSPLTEFDHQLLTKSLSHFPQS